MSAEPTDSVRGRTHDSDMPESMTGAAEAFGPAPIPQLPAEAAALLALNASAHRLFALGAEDVPTSEKSTAVQVLGEDVERHAHALIAAVRKLRGVPDKPARVVDFPTPSATAPAPVGPGPLTGERVRRTMEQLETFTLSELTGALNCREAQARKYVHAALVATPPVIKNDGRMGGKLRYAWCGPATVHPPDPTSHPKGPDPERMAGVGTERRATGEPIRVAAMARLTRKQRSTGGMAHFHRQRDARYERAQQAQAERAEVQQAKAKDTSRSGGGKGKKARTDDRVRNEAKRIEAEARARAQGNGG